MGFALSDSSPKAITSEKCFIRKVGGNGGLEKLSGKMFRKRWMTRTLTTESRVGSAS